MSVSEKRLSGIIRTNDESIIFTAQGHSFDFYRTEYYTPPERYGILSINSNEEGFLIGHTHDGNTIAIYTAGEAQSVIFTGGLMTSTYVIQNSNTKDENFSFKGVRFTGGILNKLYNPKPFGLEFPNNKDTIISDAGLDIKEYQIEFGKYKCKLSIGSSLSFSMNMISNKEVVLAITFENDCSLKDYTMIYTAIYNMCCLLTLRKNIRFEKIELLQPFDKKPNMLISTATCYEKDYFAKETSKRSHNFLSFHMLDARVVTLFPLMFPRDDDSMPYNSDFIPDDDDDVLTMSSIKIRKICSALECELGYITNIETKETKSFKLIVEQIKEMVSAHRSGKDPLPPKVYDVIFGNISNWEMPLAERIWNIYKEYEEAIQEVITFFKFRPRKIDIENYVKHRNKTTHGKPLPLDKSAGNTGFVLVIVTYCCILKRIGFSKDDINKMMKKRIFR